MADEDDSVNISQLKALVMAFEPEVSFVTHTPAEACLPGSDMHSVDATFPAGS